MHRPRPHPNFGSKKVAPKRVLKSWRFRGNPLLVPFLFSNLLFFLGDFGKKTNISRSYSWVLTEYITWIVAGADVKVWAVEKNPNAVVTLRLVTGSLCMRYNLQGWKHLWVFHATFFEEEISLFTFSTFAGCHVWTFCVLLDLVCCTCSCYFSWASRSMVGRWFQVRDQL